MEKTIPHDDKIDEALQIAREWADSKLWLKRGFFPLLCQYQKLIEAADAILASRNCTISLADSRRSRGLSAIPFRLVDDKYLQDTAQRLPGESGAHAPK